MKDKKIKILLSASLFIVWGLIAYRFVVYYFPGNDNTSSIERTIFATDIQKELPVSEDINYEKLKRDPFVKHRIPPQKKKTVADKEKIEIPMPSIKIKGVVSNGGKMVAVIEDVAEQKTIFLKQGDKYKEIQIKEISLSFVKVKYNKKVKVLTIE